jgi:GT2 family glycosyltransferase
MDKFSVIIPTIWKGETLNNLLINFYNCELVEEVVLINNDSKNSKAIPLHDKLIYVEPQKNLFVNPSWNLGVRMSKSNNIIISNDDILFDVDYFINSLIDVDKNYINFKELGIIGMHSDNYKLESNSSNVSFKSHGMSESTGGWACLLAFNKKNWTPIPEQLKIYYGDNFLLGLGKQILDMEGLKVETKMSSSANTSVDWVKEVTDNDLIEWLKLINNGKITN